MMKINQVIRRALSIRILVATLTLCAIVVESQGFDWPRWRGPNGDGISLETGWDPMALAGGPRVLWKANIGVGYSNVAIAGMQLYAMGFMKDNYIVSCLHADTGKPIWNYSFPNNYKEPQATPTIDGESVYVLGNEGILLCLDGRNGKLRWEKDLVADCGAVKPYYGFAGSPVIAGDLVLLTANASGMALDKETGEQVWGSDQPSKELANQRGWGSFMTSGTDYLTPVIFSIEGKQSALFSSWKGISSVDIQTGEPMWIYTWESYGSGHGGDPAVSGRNILLTFDLKTNSQSPMSVLLEMGGDKARVLWKSHELWTDFTTPVILDGFIYGCLGGPDFGSARLRCVDLETGGLKWEHNLGGGRGKESLSLIAATGKLIILNEQGTLCIAEADPNGYKEISRCDVLSGAKRPRKFWSPPVLCNGRIYCRNFAGDLVCIDVSK